MNHLFHSIYLSVIFQWERIGYLYIIIKQHSECFDIFIISGTIYGVILFSIQKDFKELDFVRCALTLFQMLMTSGHSIMS